MRCSYHIVLLREIKGVVVEQPIVIRVRVVLFIAVLSVVIVGQRLQVRTVLIICPFACREIMLRVETT